MLLLAWSSGAVLLPGHGRWRPSSSSCSSRRVGPRHATGGLAWRSGLAGFLLLTRQHGAASRGTALVPHAAQPARRAQSSVGPARLRGLGSWAWPLLVAALALAAAWLAQRYRHAHAVQRRQLLWVAAGAAAMTVTVGLLFVARYLGTTSDPDGEILMLVAALGSILFPMTLFRFVTVTASAGRRAMDDLTFLFTDLQDSTLMYERVGDATAYDLVRVHFKVLEIGDARSRRRHRQDHRRRHHGPLPRPRRRRSARPSRCASASSAWRRRARRELVLRIGLHRGPAIAVSVRDRIDYFGQTVNAAARIQAAAAPGEIVLSDDVYRGVGVAELLVGYDLIAERRKLRGVSTEMLLHRVASAPRGLDEADLSMAPSAADLAGSEVPREPVTTEAVAADAVEATRRPARRDGARSGRSPADRDLERRSTALEAPASEPLEAVIGGVLVDLCAGRDVERRVDEAVDRLARVQDRLADMDELGGLLADDVDAQQAAVVAAEDELDEAVRGAGDEAPRVAGEARTGRWRRSMPASLAASSVRPTMATSGME